jgi:hypothetical protein
VVLFVPDLLPARRYQLVVTASDKVRSVPEFGSHALMTRKEGEADTFRFTTSLLKPFFGTARVWLQVDEPLSLTVEPLVKFQLWRGHECFCVAIHVQCTQCLGSMYQFDGNFSLGMLVQDHQKSGGHLRMPFVLLAIGLHLVGARLTQRLVCDSCKLHMLAQQEVSRSLSPCIGPSRT